MNNDNVIPIDDPRWEEALKALSDDEFIAYMQHLYEVISADRESFSFVTDEILESLKANREDFLKEVAKCKRLDAEAAAAEAKLNASADKYLANLDDHGKKGH